MSSKLWGQRGCEKPNADLERAKRAADWNALREAFVTQLRLLGQEPSLPVRRVEVNSLELAARTEEHAWWPADRVEQIERELREADERGDVRGVHLHGGIPLGNAALATVALLECAAEGGSEASLAMLMRALVHVREARSRSPWATREVAERAPACIDSVHPILDDLRWHHGCKDVLPIHVVDAATPKSLEELGAVLARDAAALIGGWVPVSLHAYEWRPVPRSS